MPPVIRAESPADHPAVREVHRQAFCGDEEAALVDALRAAGDACLSLVAVEGNQVVGHLLFSRMAIDTTTGALDALAEPLAAPFSGAAFMALELQPGALSGVRGTVRYPPGFGLVA